MLLWPPTKMGSKGMTLGSTTWGHKKNRKKAKAPTHEVSTLCQVINFTMYRTKLNAKPKQVKQKLKQVKNPKRLRGNVESSSTSLIIPKRTFDTFDYGNFDISKSLDHVHLPAEVCVENMEALEPDYIALRLLEQFDFGKFDISSSLDHLPLHADICPMDVFDIATRTTATV